MTDIVSACSNLVQRYCNRDFVATVYDEAYDGSGSRLLLLNQYPILSVQHVSYVLTNVCMVRFTDQSYARAYWSLDSTNLTLYTEINGGISTTVLARSSYATVADLATVSTVSAPSLIYRPRKARLMR